jgi:hypothetical protein
MRYNPLTLVLLYIHFVPMAVDAALTYGTFMAAGHMLTESNPLIVLFGNWGVLFSAIVIVLHYFMITWYSERGVDECWLVVTIVCWGVLVRGLAIYSNIVAIGNPVSYEIASTSEAYSAPAKIAYYNMAVLIFAVIPFAIQYGSFKLFKLKYAMIKKVRV